MYMVLDTLTQIQEVMGFYLNLIVQEHFNGQNILEILEKGVLMVLLVIVKIMYML